MTVASGQRRTDTIAAVQRYIDVSGEILLLEPDAAPLTQVLSNLNKDNAKDSLFSWVEDTLESRFDAVNNGAGYSSTATSVVVDTGTLFAAEDLVKVPRTGEVISVTSISTNTLTVERGIGGTTAAALVDDDPLYVIGTAAEEGDTSQEARSSNPTKVDNYTQIFKHSIKESGTVLSSSNQTSPHDWVHQNRKTMIEHQKDKELNGIFGTPGTRTGADGGPRRTTGGLLNYLTQNNQDAGGTLTEAEWEQWLRGLFRYGSKTRTVFCSRLVGSVLNQYSAGKLNTFVGADTYGVTVRKFLSIHGTVNLIVHDLLEGAVYGGYAIGVDMRGMDLAYKYLNGDGPGGSRDTHVRTNVQAPDKDGRQDEILSECGFKIAEAPKHGVLTGVTG
jgi:hypothetical protein